MKRMLTFITAFAVAFVFAFLITASPPNAATKSANMNEFSFSPVKPVQAEFVSNYEQQSVENIVYSSTALRNHALRADAGFNIEKSFGLTINPKPIDKYQALYKSPYDRFFNGFDNPARAKI